MKYAISVETGNGLRHYEVEFPELRRLILGGARIYDVNLVKKVEVENKPYSNRYGEVNSSGPTEWRSDSDKFAAAGWTSDTSDYVDEFPRW